MSPRDQLKALAMFLALTLYYFLVLGPLMDAVASGDGSGPEALADLEANVLKARKTLAEKTRKHEVQEAALKEKYGTLRPVSSAVAPPVDSLLKAIELTSAEVGATVRSAVPLSPIENGVVTMRGVSLSVHLPSEEQFSRLVNGLRRADRCPDAMVHGTVLRRLDTGIDLQIAFTLLTDRLESNSRIPAKAVEEWRKIQRKRTDYRVEWLLTPRPQPSPAALPVSAPSRSPRPSALPVASAPDPIGQSAPAATEPPAPVFSGRVIGLVTLGRVDGAIVAVDGQEKVVAVGEKLGGWVVRAVHHDRVELASGQRSQMICVNPIDEPAPAASPAPPPPGGAHLARGAPELGLTGSFLWIPQGTKLQAPYDKLTRAFKVTSVKDGGLADKANVRTGDRILEVNGTLLENGGQLSGARDLLGKGQQVELTLERAGDVTRSTVVP